MVKTVRKAMEIVNVRAFKPWLWPSYIYNLSSMARYMRPINERIREYIDGVMVRKTGEILARKNSITFEPATEVGFKVRFIR